MEDYTIFPMHDIMEEDSEEKVQSLLGTFRCTRDHDREAFLLNRAVMFEKKGLGRTYIAVSGDAVVGYFTLGIKCMRIPDDTPFSANTRKKMNIDPTTGVAQSYLLGQLGRSDDSRKGLGACLLRDAIDIVKQANGLVGCRVLRVDCTDDLLDYYRKHGFVLVTRSDYAEGMGQLNQMIMII